MSPFVPETMDFQESCYLISLEHFYPQIMNSNLPRYGIYDGKLRTVDKHLPSALFYSNNSYFEKKTKNTLFKSTSSQIWEKMVLLALSHYNYLQPNKKIRKN